jgi:hypothetical protein
VLQPIRGVGYIARGIKVYFIYPVCKWSIGGISGYKRGLCKVYLISRGYTEGYTHERINFIPSGMPSLFPLYTPNSFPSACSGILPSSPKFGGDPGGL